MNPIAMIPVNNATRSRVDSLISNNFGPSNQNSNNSKIPLVAASRSSRIYYLNFDTQLTKKNLLKNL